MLWLVLVMVAVVLLYVRMSTVIRRVTIYEYQAGVRFDRGRLTKPLTPGRYWMIGSGARVDVMDVRPRSITIAGQEVLTKDSVSIKISLLVRFRVLDPQKSVMSADSYEQTLYAASQVALRELVAGKTIEELLETRAKIDESLVTAVRPQAGELGLELLALSIKDIMFPGPLKEAFAQTARAKQEGQARLERARSENAALRSLANAARLMEGNPRLYELRLLHALTEAKGSLVVKMGPTPSAGGSESDGEED
jgi:regulator of protease activity HflC (stomatin/prohibitin superfamily)